MIGMIVNVNYSSQQQEVKNNVRRRRCQNPRSFGARGGLDLVANPISTPSCVVRLFQTFSKRSLQYFISISTYMKAACSEVLLTSFFFEEAASKFERSTW
jgi:hypothetical protein